MADEPHFGDGDGGLFEGIIKIIAVIFGGDP
jgi:hypothetical protein